MKARRRRRWIQRLVVCCLLPLVAGLHAQTVSACTPAPPTPWFDTQLKVISTNVPAEVSFAELDYGSLRLQNNTASTIRIPILGAGADNDGYEKIPTGKAGNIAWTGVGIGEATSSTEYLYINGNLVSTFESRNVIQDNRPPNPKIPESRTIPLHMLIGYQQFDLQLRVNYTLNQYYRSDSVYMFSHGCINWANRMLLNELAPLAPVCGFVLLWLLALAAGIYIFVRAGRGKGKSSPGSGMAGTGQRQCGL